MSMNTYILYAKATLAALLAAPLLWACSEEEVPDPQLYTPEGVPFAYVSIGFSTGMNPVTKAETPTGGEGGDGDEKGQVYENQINNIHLFFYNIKDPTKDGEVGVNMHHDTTIVAHKYLTIGEFEYSDTQATTDVIPVENLLVGNAYHVLAVVNAGENYGKDFAKLRNLQEATVTTLYTYDEQNKKYSNFLMSSERDEDPRLTIYANNSEGNPASTEIYVERVTARVDYRLADDFSEEIKSGKDVIATAEITGAMLVNTLNSDATSYLLKRVTKENAGFNTDVIFLGDEKLSDDKTASNYVIDPYAGKTKSESDFESATYFPSIDYDNASDWEKDDLFIKGDEITVGSETWNRIGYPKENVNQNGSKDRSTGVVFRAEITLPDATAPATFFMWNGSIYKTLEKAMEAFDPNGWKLVTSATYWNEINTYGDLKTKFIDRLKSGDPTGYKVYLLKQVEGKGDEESVDKNSLSWTYYMEYINHYKSTDGVVTVDVNTNAGTTRRLLHAYNVGTYKEGVCYYTYWIKHANDQKPENDLENGDGSGVMEYAIVRNNVYKLSVKGMGSIGGDIPGDESLMINFSVKDWTLLEAEDIELTDNTQEGGGV